MAPRKSKVPKTRGAGTLTEKGYKNWIISLLRRGTLRWKPRNEVLKEALVGKKVNEKTGRMANHYRCVSCECEFPLKGVRVDHIIPVVGEEGFIDWDTYIHRMFCEKDGLQVLCVDCHKGVTAEETTMRVAARKK